MEQLGRQWTSGELARRYPDHIRAKRSAEDDVFRLEKYVYPLVPGLPMAAFTLDHAETIMRAIPEGRSSATRRHVAQLLHRLCAMAVFPLRLIAQNPLPKGFLPKVGPPKAKGWLYPAADAALLASPAVPLAWRMLYGFLDREGPRFSEAAAVTWADVDVHGALTLDVNKTDDPRAWALRPDVFRALCAWRAMREASGEAIADDDRVFIDEHGAPVPETHLADRFRDHLRAAGVTRAALFERSKARMHIRLHDLRGTFVTIALAVGRSETWVMDRTGHRSSTMVARYRRAARTAAELGLGDLAPLDRAIPELAPWLPSPAGSEPTGGSIDPPVEGSASAPLRASADLSPEPPEASRAPARPLPVPAPAMRDEGRHLRLPELGTMMVAVELRM